MTDELDVHEARTAAPGEAGGPRHVAPGQTLAGRYRVDELLGAGGMGEVYRGADLELDIPVAIKVVPPVLARNRSTVEALKHEAKVALQLSHPSICRLHHFHAEGDTKFLVMEYIDGRTLEELLDDCDDRRMPLEQLLPIGRDIADALDCAHRLDPPIFHRDIKPSNIMVRPDGRAKLLDFGIARQIKDSMTRVTGQETSGTLLYMAPEQYQGRDPSSASDIYSLAATLYEALAGHAPFHQGAIGHQVLNMAPAGLADVPEHVNAALQAGLAKDPAERPASARQLVDMLAGAPGPAAGETSGATARNGMSVAQTIVARSVSVLQVQENQRGAGTQAPPAPGGAPSVRRGWRVGGVELEPWKVLTAAGALVAALVLIVVLASVGGGDDGGNPEGNANAAVGGPQAPAAGMGEDARADAGSAERQSADRARQEAEGLKQRASDEGAFRQEMVYPDGEYEQGLWAFEQQRWSQARQHFLQAKQGYEKAIFQADQRRRKNDKMVDNLLRGANRRF